jgi:hypothetical protein
MEPWWDVDSQATVAKLGTDAERADGPDDAMSVLPPRGGCHDAT